MKKLTAQKIIFCLMLIAACGAAFFACAAPEPPALQEIQRVAPYANRGEQLSDGLVYPDFSSPLIPSQTNAALIDSLYAECDSLLNSDEASGETLEQRIEGGRLIKHPLSDEMFGQVPDNAPRVIKDIVVTHKESDFIMTGLYAPAGETISITIPESFVGECVITVAPSYADIPRSETLTRLPKIKREFIPASKDSRFGTPYGGLIAVELLTAPPEPIMITISGAVETPHYVLGKTTAAAWEKSKNTKGLTAHFDAGNVQIICPVNSVALPDSPIAALEFWRGAENYLNEFSDSASDAFIFFDSYAPLNAHNTQSEPCSFGLGSLESFFDVPSLIKNGAWDIFYGLSGRKVYSAEWADKDELTFMLALSLSMQKTMFGSYELSSEMTGVERYSSYHAALNIAKTSADASGFDTLDKDARLSMYAILVHRFGFDGLKSLFSSLADFSPQSEPSRRDEILLRACTALSYDMRMFFDYFKFNNSFSAKDTAAKMNLPVFYPAAIRFSAKSFYAEAGGSYRLDAESSLISLYGDVSLLNVSGSKGAFTETEKNVFMFTPVKTDKKVSGVLTSYIKTPSETLRQKSFFYSPANNSALPAAFAKNKAPYMFVVPTVKYIALFSSLGAGVLAGIAFALAAYKRKNKTKDAKEISFKQ